MMSFFEENPNVEDKETIRDLINCKEHKLNFKLINNNN